MKKKIKNNHLHPVSIFLWLFALVILVIIVGVASAGKMTSFHCTLGLDGRAIAEADLRLSEDGSKLHYTVRVHHAEDITMAHLHLGKIKEIGTPIAWLYPPSPPPQLIPGAFEGVLARGTITRDDLMGSMRGKPLSALVEEIRAENVFINIHTLAHAHGDICGPVYLIEN